MCRFTVLLAALLILIINGAISAPVNDLIRRLSDRPVVFTENRGQWDERVLFKAEASGGLTWFLERDGFTLLYSIPDLSAEPLDDPRDQGLPENFHGREPKVYPHKGHALKFRFVQEATPPCSPPTDAGGDENRSSIRCGGDVFRSPLRSRGESKGGSFWLPARYIPASTHEVIPSARLPHNNNYFLGNDPSKWAPDCGNYRRVMLHNIWDGIDVEWYGVNGLVEFDFVVHPSADPSQIGLRIDGLEGELEVTADGEELLLPTTLGELRLALPEAYQPDGNGFAEVPAMFTLKEDNLLGVTLPEGYEAGQKLVIDPLVYSTYLGGGSLDEAYALAPDGDGGVVVAGRTDSNDFPTTEGAFDRVSNGENDIFVARLSGDGRELLFSTYLGGRDNDEAYALTPDGAGGVVVAGRTYSNNFPTTEGALDREFNGARDVFVARLSGDGRELLYSTYLGGGDDDWAKALVPDGAGGVVMAGTTYSDDFPVTEGAYQVGFAGEGNDAFVTRLDIGIIILSWIELPDTIEVDESDLVEFTISSESSDEEAELSITYQSDNLPDAAQFADHGDGSGTFTWQTTCADSGHYSAIFTLSDGENELEEEVVIIVHNVNSPPQPFNLLAPEDGLRVRYDPDSLGTVDFVWEEARQDSTDADTVSYWMTFSVGMTQYTIGPLDSTRHGFSVQALADSMGLEREGEITFNWNVWAMDSEEHVYSSNGPWTLTIPALGVSGFPRGVPGDYYLSANHPNPFNSVTQIQYGLPKTTKVALTVYDVMGREVQSLIRESQSAGHHSVTFDGSQLASGVYVLRLKCEAVSFERKMMLLK